MRHVAQLDLNSHRELPRSNSLTQTEALTVGKHAEITVPNFRKKAQNLDDLELNMTTYSLGIGIPGHP
jgi:hypothetical protein